MEENFLNKQFIPENFQDIDSFFDNIPECDEDFTFLQDQNAFGKAHLLFQETSSSSNDCSEGWKNGSAIQTISTESTEAENDINIPQTKEKALSACAVVDIIDGEIKYCDKTEKLHCGS